MALLTTARTAQGTLVSTFRWNDNDTMVPKSGGTPISGSTAVDFGRTNIIATTFVVIPLPPNSVVTGGFFARTTAFDTAAYTCSVGDSSSAARYLASADYKAAATTALAPTGFVNASGLNIELVITNTDVCTTGTGILVVEYIVLDRATAVQIA